MSEASSVVFYLCSLLYAILIPKSGVPDAIQPPVGCRDSKMSVVVRDGQGLIDRPARKKLVKRVPQLKPGFGIRDWTGQKKESSIKRLVLGL